MRSGQYLIRRELLALHSTNAAQASYLTSLPTRTNWTNLPYPVRYFSAQYYPSLLQAHVNDGTGTLIPTHELMRFPGGAVLPSCFLTTMAGILPYSISDAYVLLLYRLQLVKFWLFV